MELFDVRLVGFNAENGRKLLLSVALIAIVIVVRRLLRGFTGGALRGARFARARFWVGQAWDLLAAVVILLGLLSLWFDDPRRLATAIGLITAGLAFALQRVVTAVAGYVVLVRGKVFSIGDRIVMGGVRGDVIAMTFTQTQIMEMGQPPPVQESDPAIWVQSRQYTGRIVSVSNARIFEEPVYNYTREFAYLWEELRVPIHYTADRALAERILLEVADRHTAEIQQMSDEARDELCRRYLIQPATVAPRAYLRMTDNWLEVTVRFVAREHGVRDLKDAMTRDILARFDDAGITIASATYEVTGLPDVHVTVDADHRATPRAASPKFHASRRSE